MQYQTNKDLLKLFVLSFLVITMSAVVITTSNISRKQTITKIASEPKPCLICFGIECLNTQIESCDSNINQCSVDYDCGGIVPQDINYACKNNNCVPDYLGTYDSKSDCTQNCGVDSQTKFSCDSASFSCVKSADGNYKSYSECLTACNSENPFTNQKLPCSSCVTSKDCPLNSSCSNAGCMIEYTQTDSRWSSKKYYDIGFSRGGCGPTAYAMLVSSFTPIQTDPYQAEVKYINDDDGYYSAVYLQEKLSALGFKFDPDYSNWDDFSKQIADSSGLLGWLHVNITSGADIDHHTLLVRVVGKYWYLQDPFYGRLACTQNKFNLDCITTKYDKVKVRLLNKWFITPPTALWCG